MRRLTALKGYISFWLYIMFFKIGAGLQYTLLAPLGARILPVWVVGGVLFMSTMLQVILDIPAGKLLDKYGYKRMLLLGTSGALIGVLVFFYGITLQTFVLSVFLVDFGWLFWTPGTNAYILSNASKTQSIKFMAYRDVFGAFGIVIGVVLLPFVVNAAGGVLAVLLGGALVASMIVLSIAPRERKQINAEKNPNPHLNTHVQRAYFFANASKAIKRLTPASTLLLLLDFSSGIFYGVVWFVIPLIIASALYNGVLLSAGLAAIDFTTIIVGSYLSRLTKSNTLKGLIFAGLVLFSASGFLLGTSFGAVFILFAILSSTGDEMASLPLWVWLHQLDKKHNQDGLISGILELGSELGWALGPLTAGILYTIVGPSWAIALGAIPVAVVLCIYYFSVRKHVIKMSLFIVPPRPHRARHKS